MVSLGRVKISGEQPEPVWGAGILLSPTVVLTCWDVIGDPDGKVLAGFPDIPALPAVRVTISGDSADLVTLHLAEAAPVPPVRLTDRTWGRSGRVFGYPPDIPAGRWVTLTVSIAADARTGWRRLHRTAGSAALGRGFSGGGVHDETGAVFGIVVARAALSGHIVPWMIPAERWPKVLSDKRISIPRPARPLGFGDKRALAAALGQVPLLATPEGRRLVVQNLPLHIRRTVPSYAAAGLELFGLVDAVLGFDGGFAQLFAVVESFAGPGAIAVEALRRLGVRLGLLVSA